MKKKILIVDDSETARLGLKNTFIDLKYENIAEAANGQVALDLIDKGEIMAIITDIHMPVMNGLEMCKIIQEKYKDQKIPIVVLSSDDNPTLKTELKKFGVVAWMVKPYSQKSISNLLKVLEKKFKLIYK